MDGFNIGYKHKCYRGNVKRSPAATWYSSCCIC